MNNSINRPAGLGKRVLGALIDIFIVIFLTILVNSYVATPIANNHFDLEVKETLCADYQEQYYKIAQDDYDIGTYERDGNSFKFTYKLKEEGSNEGYTQEEINKKIEEFEKDEKVIEIGKEKIQPLADELSNMYFIMIVFCLTIAELLIFLVVPLLTKRSSTIGQLICKLGTVHKEDIDARSFQLILRFLTILLIETILVFYFFSYGALIISPIISLIIMALNNNRNCLHDLLSSTKVVANDAIIFKDLEEKRDFLNQKETPNKKDIDEETKELIDNFKFMDEQEQMINEEEEK